MGWYAVSKVVKLCSIKWEHKLEYLGQSRKKWVRQAIEWIENRADQSACFLRCVSLPTTVLILKWTIDAFSVLPSWSILQLCNTLKNLALNIYQNKILNNSSHGLKSTRSIYYKIWKECHSGYGKRKRLISIYQTHISKWSLDIFILTRP